MSSPRGGGGIFISYRREDSSAYARLLYDRLSRRFGEDRIFMDVDTLVVGVDFTRAIIAAVSGCGVLLALIGRNWLTITDGKRRRRIENPDDLVRIEIETALQRNIQVVPVLVDGAGLPRESDLPSSLRTLRGRQMFQLSYTGFESEISRLIEALRGFVTGRGRWNLELVADEGRKKTFRLSSDREAHDISVRTGLAYWEIGVDGIAVVNATGQDLLKEIPLRGLSSKLRSDVYIMVNRRGSFRVKSIVLTVGDQVLTCESGIG